MLDLHTNPILVYWFPVATLSTLSRFSVGGKDKDKKGRKKINRSLEWRILKKIQIVLNNWSGKKEGVGEDKKAIGRNGQRGHGTERE